MEFIKRIPLIITAVLMSWILIDMSMFIEMSTSTMFAKLYVGFRWILLVGGLIYLAIVTFSFKEKKRIVLLKQGLFFVYFFIGTLVCDNAILLFYGLF